MIIQIRGTTGSGKSWAMREVLRRLITMSPIEAYFIEGKSKPQWYWHVDTATCIPGHYDTECGGCDLVAPSSPKVYELIKLLKAKWAEKFTGLTVATPFLKIACEGLLLSEDVKWTTKLKEDYGDVRVLFLTTPLDECISRANARRAAKGKTEPMRTENTSKRFDVIAKARDRLITAGVTCRRVSSTQAPDVVMEWLLCKS